MDTGMPIKKADPSGLSVSLSDRGSLLVSRYFITWKSLKNLVTISAILTVLPMANLAPPLVASWKIRTAPPESFL